VADGRGKFWFRKNGWLAHRTPDSVWTIVKWQDNPIGGMAAGPPSVVDEQTWGAIKALFGQ
jgi:hypothetical protein